MDLALRALLVVIVVGAAMLPGIPAFAQMPSFADIDRAMRYRREREAAEQARADREAQEARDLRLRRAVGSYISEGLCAEARNAALSAGDFDLAERATKICIPAGPAKPCSADQGASRC